MNKIKWVINNALAEAEAFDATMQLILTERKVRVRFSDDTEIEGTATPYGLVFSQALTDEQLRELLEGRAEIIEDQERGDND